MRKGACNSALYTAKSLVWNHNTLVIDTIFDCFSVIFREFKKNRNIPNKDTK